MTRLDLLEAIYVWCALDGDKLMIAKRDGFQLVASRLRKANFSQRECTEAAGVALQTLLLSVPAEQRAEVAKTIANVAVEQANWTEAMVSSMVEVGPSELMMRQIAEIVKRERSRKP